MITALFWNLCQENVFFFFIFLFLIIAHFICEGRWQAYRYGWENWEIQTSTSRRNLRNVKYVEHLDAKMWYSRRSTTIVTCTLWRNTYWTLLKHTSTSSVVICYQLLFEIRGANEWIWFNYPSSIHLTNGGDVFKPNLIWFDLKTWTLLWTATICSKMYFDFYIFLMEEGGEGKGQWWNV